MSGNPIFSYQYREFKNSKLATLVDKHTHSRDSRVIITVLVNLVVFMLLILLDGALPKDSFGRDLIFVVVCLLGVLAFFEPWLIRKASDRFDWAGKIAAAEAKRKK